MHIQVWSSSSSGEFIFSDGGWQEKMHRTENLHTLTSWLGTYFVRSTLVLLVYNSVAFFQPPISIQSLGQRQWSILADYGHSRLLHYAVVLVFSSSTILYYSIPYVLRMKGKNFIFYFPKKRDSVDWRFIATCEHPTTYSLPPVPYLVLECSSSSMQYILQVLAVDNI